MSDQPSKNSNKSVPELPSQSGRAETVVPTHAQKEGKEPTGAVEHDSIDNTQKIQDMHVEDDQSDSNSSGASSHCLLTRALRPENYRYVRITL